MCRFLFNYISWPQDKQSKIKKTRFITDNLENYKICLNYEKQIDKINKEMTGSLRTLPEVQGVVEVRDKKIPKEKKNKQIETFVKKNNIKKFKVYDGNDDYIWNKVCEFWLDFKNKELKKSSKSFPTMEGGFYLCSTTKERKKFDARLLKKTLDKLKWYSNLQLLKNNFKYIRLYVGYENIEDPSEYTIFIRCMELEENEIVKKFLMENY